MGAKLYADTATKRLVVTLAPDVNNRVTINTQIDIWSDLIEDWETDVDLRKFTFPLVAIGGVTISTGKLGTSYVLLDPWQIAPYEADHELVIDGNLATELEATVMILPTVGGYTVSGTRKISTLVEVVETGTTGLTPAESAKLDAIDTGVIAIDTRLPADPADQSDIDAGHSTIEAAIAALQDLSATDAADAVWDKVLP